MSPGDRKNILSAKKKCNCRGIENCGDWGHKRQKEFLTIEMTISTKSILDQRSDSKKVPLGVNRLKETKITDSQYNLAFRIGSRDTVLGRATVC